MGDSRDGILRSEEGSKDRIKETVGSSKGPSPADEARSQSPSQEGSKAEEGLDFQRDKISKVDFQNTITHSELCPPLPPRPREPELFHPGGNLQRSSRSLRPSLQSTATTALSLTDINTQSYQDGIRETFAASTESTLSGKPLKGFSSIRRFKVWNNSEGDDSASLKSYGPTLETAGDVESLLGEVLGTNHESPTWKLLGSHGEKPDPFDSISYEEDPALENFEQEFDEIEATAPDGNSEEHLQKLWRSKRKHFLILSSAGKPIYNRHGDDNLISGYVGVIQTIISFYEGANDRLKGFTAGDARFVVMTQGPLYLVAISKLGESDSQLGVQLEALYMQILSTLTLPNLTHLFSSRPSTDLRRPLQGTEPLLSALADSFTRGSPPTLLSALECLKVRNSHRQVINNTLLLKRCDALLYGLIVAGGKLVSVVRPRRHSLHPTDLQLIFNMLFEAEGIKAGGDESWIPLCLPGFNKNGYLYMYVSFIYFPDAEDGNDQEPPSNSLNEPNNSDEAAILLISANKESFYELRKMRETVVADLEANGSMAVLRAAVHRGRPATTNIVPGTVLRHFLYKSRAHVQFSMPAYEPHFSTMLARRKLLSLYHSLHATVHAKNSHLKVHHCVSRESISLVWATPLFELYCVADPHASRNALAQSAYKVVQWAQREEERIFIIGGAVF